MLEKLVAAHEAGKLKFFGEHAHLADGKAFAAFLAPLRKTRWFVYSKRPFAGPKAVLAYLSRYTHRVAISNSRLIAADADSVTFKVKDYRIEGPGRYTTMTLGVGEFIRRFLLHVLPKGFHRIRHYGLLAGTAKAEMVAKARELLAVPATEPERRRGRCDGARPAVPLLRRAHAHHRDLRARHPPEPWLVGACGRHQDRHVMSTHRPDPTPSRFLLAGQRPAAMMLAQ